VPIFNVNAQLGSCGALVNRALRASILDEGVFLHAARVDLVTWFWFMPGAAFTSFSRGSLGKAALGRPFDFVGTVMRARNVPLNAAETGTKAAARNAKEESETRYAWHASCWHERANERREPPQLTNSKQKLCQE
jgi:hypothetical protein